MTQQETNEQQERLMEMTKARYSAHGNLNDKEINELIEYLFGTNPPNTIASQIRMHYLKAKDTSPKNAESMMSELEKISKDELESQSGLQRACIILGDFMNGFTIRYGGETYTAMNKKYDNIIKKISQYQRPLNFNQKNDSQRGKPRKPKE